MPAGSSVVPHVLVIGGGFSGSLAAIQLAKQSRAPLRVTLLNGGRASMGRGVAYSASRGEHLLNVPAKNMSAFPDQPTHFVDWLRERSKEAAADEALPNQFMPRQTYGDYLQSLLRQYTQSEATAAPAARLVSIETVDGEAVDVEAGAAEVGGASVLLADGRHLLADRVLLATGNEPPAPLPGSTDAAVASHTGWCANPWSMDWSRVPTSGSGASIVLLGTGLTTVDCIITLLALKWEGTIHAVSRHALLPLSHTSAPMPNDAETAAFPPADVTSLSLHQLAALMEANCARLTAAGEKPQFLVDKMRPHTQAVWQHWSLDEKQQFVRKYAARWNILRHRIAPSLHVQLAEAKAAGRLVVSNGSIQHIRAVSDSLLAVELTSHETGDALPPIQAALVINCTGPHTRFSHTTSPLLQKALQRGLLQPDAMDMGVAVESDFSAVTPRHETGSVRVSAAAAPGRPGDKLFYAIGPLLRGTLWESIAVPELRGQTDSVARNIISDLAAESDQSRSDGVATAT